MNATSKPSACVLGANGFLGQNLCYWLTKNNFKVIAVGSQEEFQGAAHFNDEIEYFQADISDYDQLLKVTLETDLIYLMAAKTGTLAGFDDYRNYVISNEFTLLNLLKAYKELNLRGRIIFPSSRLVYKGIKETFLKEDAEKESKTVYAANKIACENYLYAWANLYDIPYTIYRICVPYGQLLPGDYSYGTLGFMLNQAKTKNKITLFGDGNINRTFSHVEDICTIMTQASLQANTKNETINIGSSDNFSLLKLAELISKKTHCEISFIDWPDLAKKIESGDTLFSDTKLQELFPYTYQRSLEKYIDII